MPWINYDGTRLHAAGEPVMWQLDTRGEAEVKDRMTGKGQKSWSFDVLHSESIWSYLPRPYLLENTFSVRLYTQLKTYDTEHKYLVFYEVIRFHKNSEIAK